MEIPGADQITSCELGEGKNGLLQKWEESQKRSGEMPRGHSLVKVAWAGTEGSRMKSHGEKFVYP